MVPSSWKITNLGNLATFKSGGTPPKDDLRNWGGSNPWISAKDLKKHLVNGSIVNLSDEGFSRAHVAPEGSTLVLVRGMTLLKDLPVGFATRALAFNQDVKALVPYTGVDPLFLSYAVATFKEQILELVSVAGHGTGKLDTAQLKAFELRVPSLGEQQAIARLLICWERAIEVTQRLLATARAQRRSLIGKMLKSPAATTEISDRARVGSIPPSVRAGKPRLPKTPPGWRRVRLSKHVREVRRPAVLDPDTNYTLLTVRRSRGGVNVRSIVPGSEIKTTSQFFVREGDFLISKRQIVHGACGVIPSELDGAIVSNEYAALNSDKHIDVNFLRHLSESIYFQQTCFQSSIGVHVEKMLFDTKRWLEWPFNIPPLAEQVRIVEIIDAANAEVHAIERSIDALTREKYALMRQLLTGKRRLNIASSP